MEKRYFAESELIINADGSVFHLHLKPNQLADKVILVGDPGRVGLVASHFNSIECEVQSREFHTITGSYSGKRITVTSTGIGCDNIDIVRIADISDNISGYTMKSIEKTIMFSETVKRDILRLMDLLNVQHRLVAHIVSENDIEKLSESDRIEREIDGTKKRLLEEHMQRMVRGECFAENNSLFVSLISNMERVGDHLSIMAHSVEELV